MKQPEASLYIHVPFCTKKCPYCHFYVLPDKAPFRKTLERALFLEIEQIAAQIAGYEIVSIYFGGGTPSLLGPEGIGQLLERLPRSPTQEVTLEANPENVTPPLMEGMRSIGINRISLGVQTLDNALLHRLGRSHDASRAIEAIEATHSAGIENISIDLMYDLPGQSLSSWEKTLDRLVELPITHLSLYNLTIEPNTPFYKKRKELLPDLPSPEESLAMLTAATQRLPTLGLLRYEISAFGRPSRHNSGYWTARPFLGLGPSAFSYWEKRRFRNACDLNAYARALAEGSSPIDFEEELSPSGQQAELLAIQLRLLEGVDLSAFTARHGPLLPTLTASLEKATQLGWLTPPPRLRLTEQGLLFYDSVAELLIN